MAEIQEQELLRKVDLMRRCYIKGFGNKSYAIGLNAREYVRNLAEPEKSNQFKSETLLYLNMILMAYAKIPFEELSPSSDFAPILVTRDLLQAQNQSLQDLLQSSTDVEGSLATVLYNGTTIWRVGELFREKFRRNLKELRTIPQHADYKFELIDINGRTWQSWECI